MNTYITGLQISHSWTISCNSLVMGFWKDCFRTHNLYMILNPSFYETLDFLKNIFIYSPSQNFSYLSLSQQFNHLPFVVFMGKQKRMSHNDWHWFSPLVWGLTYWQWFTYSTCSSSIPLQFCSPIQILYCLQSILFSILCFGYYRIR